MKKVFIGVLAALMLFSFIACDANANRPWNEIGKTVIAARIVSGDTNYLFGESFDPSRYQVEITYSDLTKETMSGDGILAADASQWVNAGPKDVSVVYGGTSAGLTLKVYVYEASAVKISGATTSFAYISDMATENWGVTDDSIVVTAVYGPNNAEKILTKGTADGTYTITGAKVDTAPTTDDVEVEVTVAVNGSSAATEKYDVKITPASSKEPGESATISSISVEMKETVASPFVQRAVFNADNVTVYAVYSDGAKVDVTDDSVITLSTKLTGITGLTGADRYPAAANVTINASYTYTTDDVTLVEETKTGSKQIDLREDYITGLSATAPATAVTGGATPDVSAYNFKVTSWKSGIQANISNYAGSTYEKIPSGITLTADAYPAAKDVEQTVNVTFSYTPRTKYSDQVTEYTVSGVKVAASV